MMPGTHMRTVPVLILLMLFGCSTETTDRPTGGSDAATSAAEREAGQDTVIRAAPDTSQRIDLGKIVETVHAMGSTEESILERFGEPSEIVRRDTTNPHTGDMDQVIRIEYPDLQFELYRVSSNGRELLMETVLTGDRVGRSLPVPVGAHSVQITDYFGEPLRISAPNDGTSVLRYEAQGEATSDFVNFHFVRDRLQKVEFDYYVD